MLVLSLIMVQSASATDWITAPSHYTHDPVTGERVTQYSPVGPFYTFPRADYRKSGYRHTRSSIQAGRSADHLHIVEEWGRPVRPYGEWRFPYRPYSVPYPAWGPPYAGLSQPGSYPYPYPPGAPNDQQGGMYPDPYGRQQPTPYYDGSYPSYQDAPRDARSARPPARRDRYRQRGYRSDHRSRRGDRGRGASRSDPRRRGSAPGRGD